MNYWLLKTEPSTYSYANLEQSRKACWDGVTNSLALKHIRSMAKGDRAFIYHTGDEKSIVGIAEIVSAPYPDPKLKDPRIIVIDLTAAERLKKPVQLSAIKARKEFADFALVRIGRLSVMPVSAAQWKMLLDMSH